MENIILRLKVKLLDRLPHLSGYQREQAWNAIRYADKILGHLKNFTDRPSEWRSDVCQFMTLVGECGVVD